MSNSIIIYLLTALIPLCGALTVFTPYLMPRNECFTVTIPEDKERDTRLIKLRRRYTVISLTAVIIETIIALFCALSVLAKNMNEVSFLVIYIVLFLTMLALMLILMLINRKKVKAIKEQEAWASESQERTVLITQGQAPNPLSLKWNLLYIPVVLLCTGLALFLYPLMPEQIPMQTSLSGEVTRYAQKSIGTALFPVWVNLFMILCFVFSHWTINRQKPPIDPHKPATSSYAFGAYCRAMCILVLVSGLLLCLCIGIAIPFTMIGILTLMQGALIVMIAAVIITVACIILSLLYGQNGSRLFRNAKASSGMSRDDDKYWKAGIFYVNSKDPSVFIPKRFGIGTTINFGSKTAWIVIIGFITVTVLFVILISGL